MTHPAARPDAGPVAATGRIDAIDVLRGFALLGILVMNIQSFAMPEAAYLNPTAYGDLEGANLYAWLAGRMLADQKFMAIFSMLFGAGIVLMAERAEARGGAGPVHYRRMGWLLVIGMLHAHLLWFGDILARLVVDTPEKEDRCRSMGVTDMDRVYRAADLACGRRITFAATGVTDGTLMKGVRFFGDGARTNSLVMQTRPQRIQFVDTIHLTGDSDMVVHF